MVLNGNEAEGYKILQDIVDENDKMKPRVARIIEQLRSGLPCSKPEPRQPDAVKVDW